MPAELALIVCGSRDWTDREFVYTRLDGFLEREPSLTLINGLARGVDLIADSWARRRGLEPIGIAAEWTIHAEGWCPGTWCAHRRHCCAAGGRRNQAMIERALAFDRQYVLAFKDNFNLARGSGGTEDLVRRAISAQIPGLTIRHALAAAL